jgi:translocation and assembly module TamB
MSEPAANVKRRGIGKILLLIFGCGLLLLAAFGWYLTTNSFQVMVRQRIIAELQRSTGGRVEVGSFHTNPFRLRIELLNVTIHGRESALDTPYAHVDQLVAEIKVVSLLEREFGFRSLVLERPVIHIIFYPDGTTNQPQPGSQEANKAAAMQQLFSVSINKLEVREGQLIWDNQIIPLNFQAQNISADMNYLFFSRRYDGRILIGKADARIKDYRPFAWMTELEFSLGSQYLQIKSLHATAGKSHFNATGRVENFKDPKVTLDYSTDADLGEIAAIMHDRDIRHGIFQASGQGSWSAKEFASSGKFAITDFAGKVESISATHASFASPFTVNSERLTLPKIEARMFSGAVNGELDVSNWLAPAPAAASSSVKTTSDKAKQKSLPVQQGTARFQFKDIDVGDVAAGLGPQAAILDRMNFAGDGDGSAQLRWKGTPRNAVAEIALDVTPPQQIKGRKIPLTAHLRGTYNGSSDDLELTQFDASTQNSQVHATGRLSSRAALKISVQSSNIAELQPLISSLGYKKIPSFREGNVSFNGTAAGRLSEFYVSGSVRAQDFTLSVQADPNSSPHESHWDSFHANLQFSPEAIAVRNANLKTGDASVNFDVSANLQDGHFSPQNSFTLHADLQDADIQNLMELAGYNYPMAGTADLTLRLSGSQADPHGEGSIALRDATLYGQQIQRLNADLRLIHRQAELNNIHLLAYGGSANGGMFYDLHSRNFHVNLSGTNFALAKFPQPANIHVPVKGQMDFTGQATGTLQHPVIQSNIHFHNLFLGNEELGNLAVDASTQAGKLHIAGQSALAQSQMSFKADVQLDGDLPTVANAEFTDWGTNGLLAPYLKARLTGQSSVSGTLHLQGPLLRPRDLEVTGNFSSILLEAGNVKLHNSAPVSFAVSKRVFRVEQLHMIGDATDFSASGTVQLDAPYAIDVHADGNANLGLIESFDHDFTSRGRVQLKATATGTLSQPSIDGQLQVTRGSISYINLPSGLSEINGTLLFNQHEMKVQSLTARTGGGLITVTGSANLYDRQLRFDLGVQGQDVRLRYPPGVSSTANIDLRYAGSLASSTLSGDITVTKLSVTPGFDFANYLARSEQTPALVPTNTLLSHIGLDVHITTTPELQMQTSSVRLSGDADLRVRGSVQTPAVLGRADILEGEIYFNGAKYQLQRGDIVFLDPSSIVPVLDLQANTQIRDYDITLRVTGDARRPTVNFQSEPPLPSSDIIALLALGRTNEEGVAQGNVSTLNQDASSVVLAQAFNAAVSDRVQRLFGGSRIKIDPQGLSTETNLARGPALTIEQQVTGNITLTYTTNISQTSQQIIQAQYNISQNISLVGIRDQNGVVSFDVKIRHRKK